MAAFQSAGIAMLLILSLAVLGYLARKKGWMDDAFDARLSKLLLYLAMPALMLDSVLGNQNLPAPDTVVTLLVVSAIMNAGTWLLAFIAQYTIFRGAPAQARGVYAFVVSLGNTLFIGLPIVSSIYGDNAVLYTAIYNIPYNVFLFSTGHLFIASSGESGLVKTDWKTQTRIIVKNLLSPAMISCLVAVVLVLLRVTDQGFVGKLCELLGQIVAPCALLIVGSSLGKMPIASLIKDKYAYVATFFRLLVIPVAFFLIAHPFIDDPVMLGTLTILAGTPAATIGTMMCVAYGGDLKAMTTSTFLTTFCSLITVPLLVLFMQWAG